MADIDSNNPPPDDKPDDKTARTQGTGRRPGRARGNRAGNAGAGAAGNSTIAAAAMIVDEDANRIVVDFAAARRATGRGGRQRAARRDSRNDERSEDRGEDRSREPGAARRDRVEPQAREAQPDTAAAVVETDDSELPIPVPDASDTDHSVAPDFDTDIPVIPLEPEPEEYGKDLDKDVYVAAEHGERKASRGRGGGRRRGRPSIRNPFGVIEKGERPQGHAPVPKWQKMLMIVCGIAILTLGYVALASGWIQLPGLHQGVLVRTNIEYLDRVIRLPFAPQEVTWQVLTDQDQATYGATKERLIAVMRFSPEQAAELIAQSTPMQQLPGHQQITSERWFPDEVDDLMDDVDEDTIVYDATTFVTGYFKRGVMVRLGDSGYIVAKLFNY